MMKTPVHVGPRKPKAASISTRLTLAAANAHAVYLAGTFNGWQSDTLPMKKDGHRLLEVGVISSGDPRPART